MVKEELGHVATLRKERRRAYHREHDRKKADGAPAQVEAGRLERPRSLPISSGASPDRPPPALASFSKRRSDGRRGRRFRKLPGALERKVSLEIEEILVDGYLDGRSAPMTRPASRPCSGSRRRRFPDGHGCVPLPRANIRSRN